MKKETDLPKYQFGISALKVREFAVLEKDPPANGDLNVRLDFSFGVNKEHHLIIVGFDYTYFHKDSVQLKLGLDCFFRLSVESWSKLEKDSIIKIERGFAVHLMALTLSTARGVLFAKTEGTAWATKVIQIQNMNDFISDDVTIELEAS